MAEIKGKKKDASVQTFQSAHQIPDSLLSMPVCFSRNPDQTLSLRAATPKEVTTSRRNNGEAVSKVLEGDEDRVAIAPLSEVVTAASAKPSLTFDVFSKGLYMMGLKEAVATRLVSVMPENTMRSSQPASLQV